MNKNKHFETKAGFVALIGSPNVGKSTLLNSLVGEKVSIVTHKAQTTRSCIKGIVMFENSQIIFNDTPGIFSPNRKLDRAMVKAAWNGIEDSDVICFVYDSARRLIDENTKNILKNLCKVKSNICLIMNKIDLIDNRELFLKVKKINNILKFNKVFMISALKNDGLNDLLSWLSQQMPSSPFLFNPDDISNIPSKLMATEILREKLILNLHQEIPYNLIVETESWEKVEDNSIKINQVVYVTKASHKGMVIGKSGKLIKLIGTLARKEIQDFLKQKVHLFIRVKIKEKCLEEPSLYKTWGLEVDA